MQKTILIVEDDEGILETLCYILEDSGFHIIQADDGEEFIEKINKNNVDLILLDYWVPQLNGGDIIKKLRAKKKTKQTPIIVISASQHIKDEALRLGANDFIPKPFDIDQLVNTVRRYL